MFEEFCKKLCGSTENALSALLICMLKQSEIQKAWEYQTDEKDMIEIATMLADIAGGCGDMY